MSLDIERKLGKIKMLIKNFCLMSCKNKRIWQKEIEILSEEIRSLQEEKMYLLSIGCRLTNQVDHYESSGKNSNTGFNFQKSF